MEEVFKKQSQATIKNLATLSLMRVRLEMREQVLLQKTLNLNRFIKLASLDHLKGTPELAHAHKYLEIISGGPKYRGQRKFLNKSLDSDFLLIKDLN